jgi:hypothetical protein
MESANEEAKGEVAINGINGIHTDVEKGFNSAANLKVDTETLLKVGGRCHLLVGTAECTALVRRRRPLASTRVRQYLQWYHQM